ncbi:hypothetical protein FHL15_004338 [Xylaria flabelliformis]|uniref:Uncharacterized protein n=1 Tax=Xylaria flabelliformis TaxID=2512241 RepID=A0A553I3U4_9PEZI|nr:hypothetical protein FHL15_004338 [Xylaria flabelliformis]
MPPIHHEEHSPSQESIPHEEQAPRENPNQSEEPKPYRLYVALYNLGLIFVNDLFKETTTVLCDVMDLKDDNGVEKLQDIAESAPIYDDEEDKSFCRTWVENVLQRAGENGYALRAPIEQIRKTVLRIASDFNKNSLKILEPFNNTSP